MPSARNVMLTRWTLRTQVIPVLVFSAAIFLVPLLGMMVRLERWQAILTALLGLIIQSPIVGAFGAALRVRVDRLTAGTPDEPWFEGAHGIMNLMGEFHYRAQLRKRGLRGRSASPYIRDYQRQQLRAGLWGLLFCLACAPLTIVGNLVISAIFPHSPTYFAPGLLPVLAYPAFVLGFVVAGRPAPVHS